MTKQMEAVLMIARNPVVRDVMGPLIDLKTETIRNRPFAFYFTHDADRFSKTTVGLSLFLAPKYFSESIPQRRMAASLL